MNEVKLTRAAREARRDYMRAYRAAHPEKFRRYAADYWARRAARKREAVEQAQHGKEVHRDG